MTFVLPSRFASWSAAKPCCHLREPTEVSCAFRSTWSRHVSHLGQLWVHCSSCRMQRCAITLDQPKSQGLFFSPQNPSQARPPKLPEVRLPPACPTRSRQHVGEGCRVPGRKAGADHVNAPCLQGKPCETPKALNLQPPQESVGLGDVRGRFKGCVRSASRRHKKSSCEALKL